MTPNNAVFRDVYIICQQYADVYEYAPDSHAKYPFIWLDSDRLDEQMNNDLIGSTTQTIRLYGRLTDRPLLDEYISKIRNDLYKMKGSFNYTTRVTAFSVRTMKENSNGTPLLHYSVDVSFLYNKK